ncbi:MAG: helix-turn-helix domain-containing protein [Flavobacteriales bacterium]|jgi:transcriptional regulator with XRE-family HTH domain|nr:helix-turn-helix domain-containing protein [Flavobacteriales bacterium]
MSVLSKKEIEKIKKEVPVQVGLRVAHFRKEKGITQQQLGDLIGSDRQYVSRIERADVSVSIQKLAIIAKALDVDLTQICNINY